MAQSILGMVNRQFKEIDKEDFNRIYKTYVRQHLVFAYTSMVTIPEKDKACLESVQRRATRMLKGLKNLPVTYT